MRIARICPNLHETTGGPGADVLAAEGLRTRRPAVNMMIFQPDFNRSIDLPGAGPCARPIDIDRSSTGFVNLVSLRVYSFLTDMVIEGHAEADEVFIIVMAGDAAIAVSQEGHEDATFSLQGERGQRAIYMPPHAAYRLTAISDCDIAYARVQPLEPNHPNACGFVSSEGCLEIESYATAMDLVLCTVRAGEKFDRSDFAPLPECLLHIRGGDGMAATLNGETLGDWAAAALDHGDKLTLEVKAGAADILLVTASTGRTPILQGAIENP